MANLEELRLLLEEETSKILEARELLKEIFVQEDISLEDRWDIFVRSQEFLAIDAWRTQPIDVLTDSPYDDLNLDRYQMVEWLELDLRIEENITLPGEEQDDWTKVWDDMFAKRNEFREAVLKTGSKGCVNDW